MNRDSITEWMLLLITGLIMAWSAVCAAETDNKIATIKKVKGDVRIERGEDSMPALARGFLFENDIIVTGRDGAIGVTFKDNSLLSMGPGSRLEIYKFAFDPAEEKLSFVANIVQGTMTYLSGIITKLKPDSVQFRTPSATIGIRGTHLAIQVK